MWSTKFDDLFCCGGIRTHCVKKKRPRPALSFQACSLSNTKHLRKQFWNRKKESSCQHLLKYRLINAFPPLLCAMSTPCNQSAKMTNTLLGMDCWSRRSMMHNCGLTKRPLLISDPFDLLPSSSPHRWHGSSDDWAEPDSVPSLALYHGTGSHQSSSAAKSDTDHLTLLLSLTQP